jgi:hypothetical protein
VLTEFVEVLKKYKFFIYAGNYATSDLFLLISHSKLMEDRPEIIPSLNHIMAQINLCLANESSSLRFINPLGFDGKVHCDYVLDYNFDVRVIYKISSALRKYMDSTPDFFRKYNESN